MAKNEIQYSIFTQQTLEEEAIEKRNIMVSFKRIYFCHKDDLQECSETLNDNILNVRFEAEEAKFIRVAVESYIEKMNLILRTIQRFDPQT